MKKTEIRQSNIHEKLFIATGNAFDPETFGADGIAAFVKEGFSGTYADYNMEYKKNPKKNVKVYEYYYGGSKPLPLGVELQDIVESALDSLISMGCKSIILPPIRTADKSNEENEQLIVYACANWLKNNSSAIVEKIIIADQVGQMISKDY